MAGETDLAKCTVFISASIHGFASSVWYLNILSNGMHGYLAYLVTSMYVV